MAGSDRYVLLPGGLALPVEPILLALELEARGFHMTRCGDDIEIRPFSKLTDADRAALKRWKAHVLALLDYAPPEAQ